MTRMKVVFAVLLLTAIVNFVPNVQAQAVQVIVAGSSAQWVAYALGAYNSGNCLAGATAPCAHYTNSSPGFNLVDNRPTVKSGGSAETDNGKIWIVWDSCVSSCGPSATAGPNVWAFISVDSGVGDRCYYAQPRCDVTVTTFPSAGNVISSSLWGDGSTDSTPPSSVQGLFTAGTLPVSAAATDIRPEDALFATCRANSKLGNGNGSTDGLGGLGYNSVNASGACVAYKATNTLTMLEGSDILSGYPLSTSTAHLLEFAISGKDPFTGTTIPVASTVEVGAAPVTFVFSRSNALSGATNATEAQLQTIFSGANCNGNVVGGSGGPIQAILREPTSGTMNTTEYTTFRYWNYSGASQETGVNAKNPLSAQACPGGPTGGIRSRAIGTSEEVKSVLNSNTNDSIDGIGYTFFSYGNVSSIANNSAYGYLTLDGVDPIFHIYYTSGTPVDPGQPATSGVLPAAANLPAACAGAFPCPEGDIWSGHLSFPNVRNGSYKAWSLLRAVSNGTALTALETLVKSSNTYVVTSEPDYVPFAKVGTTDPGLALLRSHFLQESVAPNNVTDRGGDVGGCILTSTGIVTTSDTTTSLIQQAVGTGCIVKP